MQEPERVAALQSIAPVLGVDDIDVALEWWCGLAGFDARFVNRATDPEEDPPNYAVLVRDAVTVHLVRRAEAEPGLARGEAIVSVVGVDALADEFDAGEPVTQPWGRSIVVYDPDGNRIELVER